MKRATATCSFCDRKAEVIFGRGACICWKCVRDVYERFAFNAGTRETPTTHEERIREASRKGPTRIRMRFGKRDVRALLKIIDGLRGAMEQGI